jgi:hypothetical protein
VAVKSEGVAIQQEKLTAQKKELRQLAAGEGDQQDLVKVVNTNDPKDKEATKTLPATQPKTPNINKHRFRLREIRTQPLARHKTRTTQYQVV